MDGRSLMPSVGDDSGVTARAIAEALVPHLGLPLGSLCVWGDWFGKPLDNMHILTGALHEGDELILDFHHREVLRVWMPGPWTMDPTASGRDPRLVIRSAERVEWGWYCYGRPETPENWSVERHWLEDGRIRATSTTNCTVSILEPSLAEPAVTFL